MTISLEDLSLRLSDDVPARDSIPSSDQYTRCVRDAVTDFSRRAGRIKITTLSLVSGTASYSLPVDFVRLIRLISPSIINAGVDGVIFTTNGLVPVRSDYNQTYTIAAGQITFQPTPTFASVYDLHYQAGWVLDADDIYQELSEEEAGILLFSAQSKALNLQANKAAQQAWTYQVGDERVSKERLAEALRGQAKQASDDYQAALKAYNGPYGTRARYADGAYS